MNIIVYTSAMWRLVFTSIFVVFFCLASVVHAEVRPILFPVDGPVRFGNDFSEPRDGGVRSHEGIDVIAAKFTPLLAVADGTISFIAIPQASWGYSITIRDTDGYTYRYVHMNNDTPGTDDGQGGPNHAYAPGLYRGARVAKGQLIGWVGDSGNAEETGAHLHFEIRSPGGSPINPYDSLVAAQTSAAATVTLVTPTTKNEDETEVGDAAAEADLIATRELNEGLTDPDVEALHDQLGVLNYYEGILSDVYTDQTREAVRQVELANQLAPTGIADIDTRKLLEENAVQKTPPRVTVVIPTQITQTLVRGARSDQVQTLQEFLQTLGYFEDEATGYFGPLTESSVIAFQRAEGIDPIGIVGPQTRLTLLTRMSSVVGTMNPVQIGTPPIPVVASHVFTQNLAQGSRGDEVAALQEKLGQLGHFFDQVTGYYGPVTATAVMSFQRAEGIDPLGIVGPQTRAALNR